MFDAVSTGLAAILGAGIFAVIAPAAAIAGPALLISLLIAAYVALCNALSSAQLAAVLPRTEGPTNLDGECSETGGASQLDGCFSSQTQSALESSLSHSGDIYTDLSESFPHVVPQWPPLS